MKKIVKVVVLITIILNIAMILATQSKETYAVNEEINNVSNETSINDANTVETEANNKNNAKKDKDEETKKESEIKKEVKLNKTKTILYIGDTYKLKVTGTSEKIKWKSSNKKIATVDSTGKVLAKKKGNAKITAKVGKESYTCKITVKAKSSKGVIYLTFDDGPSSTITPKVLDILKKEKIKATFFVLNYSKSNEKLIKRIVKDGHTIAVHGYSHDYSKIYKSKSTFMNNVYSLQKKIKKSTGVKTMYIRFPGGSSNTVSRRYCRGVMTALTKEVLSKGFKYFDWNVSSGDAGGAKTSKDVYRNVTKNMRKDRGNMVLCHDFSGNYKTLNALPDIIKYAKKHGYTFAAIDESTPMYAHHINN